MVYTVQVLLHKLQSLCVPGVREDVRSPMCYRLILLSVSTAYVLMTGSSSKANAWKPVTKRPSQENVSLEHFIELVAMSLDVPKMVFLMRN